MRSADYKKLGWIAGAWLVIGVIAMIAGGQWLGAPNVVPGVGGFVLGWVLCMINLFLVDRTSRALLRQSSGQSSGQKTGSGRSVFFWGALKLICLVSFGLVVLVANQETRSSFVWGCFTLVVVPVIYGLWTGFRFGRSGDEPVVDKSQSV